MIRRRNRTGTLTPPKYSIFDQRSFAGSSVDEVSNIPPKDHHAVKSSRVVSVMPPDAFLCRKEMYAVNREIAAVRAYRMV